MRGNRDYISCVIYKGHEIRASLQLRFSLVNNSKHHKYVWCISIFLRVRLYLYLAFWEYVYGCFTCINAYVPCVCSILRSQKREYCNVVTGVSVILEPELQTLLAPLWVLGTELGPLLWVFCKTSCVLCDLICIFYFPLRIKTAFLFGHKARLTKNHVGVQIY